MTTRRGAARCLAFVVAALAVAGTGASPQPPPLATSQASGSLEVTAERPIASVIVTLEANDAARSIIGSRLQTRVGAGQAANGGAVAPDGPTIVVIEPLDEQNGGIAGAQADVSGLLDDLCPEFQTCSGRYRITAALIDPEAQRATVEWHASLELRMDGPGRPSAAPTETRLTVRAGDPETRPAADLDLAALPVESVHLDADHPQASRFIDLVQPPGPPGVTADGTWLAFLVVSDSATGTGLPPANVRLAVPGQLGPLTGGVRGLTPFFPPVCQEPTSCTTHLRLDLGAPSGPGDGARDLDWRIVVLGIGPDGAVPPGPLGVKVIDAVDIGPDSPRLVASQSGSFEVRKAASGSKVAIVAIEAADVPQGSGPLTGFLQIRYEVRATGPAGSRTVNLGVGADVGQRSVPTVYGQLKEGGSVTLTTALTAADCAGRSRCEYGVPFFAIAPDDGPVIALEWTVAAIWYPDRGAPVPAGLDLSNRISAAPSPP